MKSIYKCFIGLIVISGFCFHSCSEKKIKSEVWNSSESSEFSLFDINQMSSYKFVKLETNDRSLIGAYDRVLANDQYLYILDKENKAEVSVFSHTGKFIRKISNIGRGPAEYTNIDDLTLSDNYLILLDSRSRKILYFSLAGEFVKTILQKEYRGMTFTSVDDELFAYYMHTSGITPDNDEILFANNTGEILDKLIPRKGLTELQGRFGIDPYFAKVKKGLYFIPVFEDKIYRWVDGQVNQVYDFEIGDEQMKFIDVTDEPVVSSNKFSYINSLFVTKSEIFTCEIYGNKKGISLCGNIRDNSLFKWSGDYKIVGAYDKYFITNLSIDLAKSLGIKVDGNTEDNDVLVFVDGDVFLNRAKEENNKK